jgi:hypothetical protein
MTDQTAVVTRVRAPYPTPLGAQHAACLVAIAQAIGQDAGLLAKEWDTYVVLPSGVAVAQDIIAFPSGQIFDCLTDAEGAAPPSWSDAGLVDASRYVAVAAAQPPVETDVATLHVAIAVLSSQLSDERIAREGADAALSARLAALEVPTGAGAEWGDPVYTSGTFSLTDALRGRTVTWTGRIGPVPSK